MTELSHNSAEKKQKKYGLFYGDVPQIEKFVEGSHIFVVCSPTDYSSRVINLENQGWEVRDCIKVLCKSNTLQIGLLRKSFKGTIASNVLKNGCGGLNIEATRIGTEIIQTSQGDGFGSGGIYGVGINDNKGAKRVGRWPANLLLNSESAELMDSQSGASRFFFSFSDEDELRNYLLRMIRA